MHPADDTSDEELESGNEELDAARIRHIGQVMPNAQTMLTVSYYYWPECPSDTGRVELMVLRRQDESADADPDVETFKEDTTVLLSAIDVLLLTRHLQRATGLVLRAFEDPPDNERELARPSVGEQ
jgi:hypothetical protein